MKKSIHFNSITQQHENFTYFTIINQALMLLPERLPNIAYVSVDKLTHKGDYLHFDTKSAEELGTRYAMTYANMCGYNEMNTIVKRTSKKAIEKTKHVTTTQWIGIITLGLLVYVVYKEYRRRLFIGENTSSTSSSFKMQSPKENWMTRGKGLIRSYLR